MPLLVDTSNVLHVTGVLPPELAGIDIAGLARLIGASRHAPETVWLICDGTGGRNPTSLRGRVVTQYSGHGREADDLLERMILDSTVPRRLLVVSSDRRIQRTARRRRCESISSEEFLQQLVDDVERGTSRGATRRKPSASPRGAVPLSARQIDQWVKDFGLTSEWFDVKSQVGAPGANHTRSATAPDVPKPVRGKAIKEKSASASTSRASAKQPSSVPSTPSRVESASRRRRALEDITSLDEVDPVELERFDMSEWLDEAVTAAVPRSKPAKSKSASTPAKKKSRKRKRT